MIVAKGIRAELTRLWQKFVAQCESIEDAPSAVLESSTPEQQIHAKGFYAGMAFAAKSIRRSVDSPRYNVSDYPFFHKKPLSEQFRERAENTRIDAQVYFLKTATEQSTAYKQMMGIARMWDEAAKMAEENGD